MKAGVPLWDLTFQDVVVSVTSGTYLYSPMLKQIVGKPYVCSDCCRRVIQSEGIVVWV